MLPLPPDPWKILGVEKTADKSEIRTAYKKLVLKCHPDKVQDPTLKAEKQEEFQKVQQAWELLNDDAERAKYEEQVQLMELRKQAALLSKNMPNSSAPRSSSKTYTYEIRTAEIRTAEPKHKSSSGGGGKVYEHYSSPHTRSHEDVAPRIYAVFEDGEKHARRAASYEKPSRREEERREKEDRRRRRDEEDRILREREREREREAREREREKERKAEKKKLRELEEKQRDKERRRDRKSPYVEDYGAGDDEVYTSTKLDKKRSSSRKHSEYREKSMSRRDREPSPAVEIIEPVPKTKEQALKDEAADYIARSRSNAAGASQRSRAQEQFYQPPVPTPPPVDFEEESIRRSSARAARRPSHDSPKERSSLHKQASQDAYVVSATPPSKARAIPSLQKTYSTPPVVPESPPHISRSNTVPLAEMYGRSVDHPPTFSRTKTWAGENHRGDDYYGEYDESDEDQRRRERRSRRNRSPQPVYDHKYAERPKASKHDSHYGYGDSPTSRRYKVESFEPATSSSYPSPGFKVKESRKYTADDVKYSPVPYSYTTGDQYATNPVYA